MCVLACVCILRTSICACVYARYYPSEEGIEVPMQENVHDCGVFTCYGSQIAIYGFARSGFVFGGEYGFNFGKESF